jgi:glycosyltransferase involved in cell wall biosynthesis
MKPSADASLRCLHYLPYVRLEDGGVVRAVIDMIQNIADAGVRVTLVTHDPKDCPSDWLDQKDACIEVVTTSQPRGGLLFTPAAFRQQIDALVARQDVVHLHTPWATMNPSFARCAAHHNKPYFVTLHGMLDDWSMSQRGFKKRAYLKLIGRKVLEQAARVHCTAASERDQSAKWYPGGTPWVMPYIVDLSPYDPQPTPDAARSHFDHLQRDGVKLLFLSRIHVKKGLERLIRACGILKEKQIAFQLAIAGPGEPDYVAELEQLVATLGITDRTHWLGMVSGEMKLSLYAASDLFVLPTSQENFGLVYPESLLCGTPVVATRGTDIWQELEEAGGLISEMTGESVAEAIVSFVDRDADTRAQLGQRGRDYVKQWLDPAAITARYEQAYRDCVAK